MNTPGPCSGPHLGSPLWLPVLVYAPATPLSIFWSPKLQLMRSQEGNGGFNSAPRRWCAARLMPASGGAATSPNISATTRWNCTQEQRTFYSFSFPG